jgi:RNA polymerase sigma-70 factor (ECF subfamily)
MGWPRDAAQDNTEPYAPRGTDILTSTTGDSGSEVLLQRCASGDRAAFRALYDRHSPQLYAVALRITRHGNLAADTLQEAFIQIWQNAKQFDTARGSAEAWMIGLTRYRALDLVRRAGPAMQPMGDEPDTAAYDQLERLDANADGRALRQCLERLEPNRRRLVVMAFVEGFSHAELAAQFVIPLGTIKSTIRRSLATLRECLEG